MSEFSEESEDNEDLCRYSSWEHAGRKLKVCCGPVALGLANASGFCLKILRLNMRLKADLSSANRGILQLSYLAGSCMCNASPDCAETLRGIKTRPGKNELAVKLACGM